MNNSSIRDTQIRSPLMEAMVLRPQRKKMKKSTIVTLALTSLVDAFSILLLYLLVQNSSSKSTLELKEAQTLPLAVKTEGLHEGTMIKFEQNQYFIGEEQVEIGQLAARLQQIKADLGDAAEANAIIIQADRDIDFSDLTPIIRAGSISGFNKFKFAVQQAEGT